MINGTYNSEIGGVYLNGGYLVVNPVTGKRWQSETEANEWWKTTDRNPSNQPEKEEIPEPEDTRKPISITEMNGTVRQPKDIEMQDDVVRVTVMEDTDMTLKGTLDIDDEAFIVPFRRDGGPLVYFNAQVKDGEFSATLNFRDSGRYEVNTGLLNAELKTPRFISKTLVVYVMRNTTSAL